MTRDAARQEYARHANEPRHTDRTTLGLSLAAGALSGAFAGGVAWLLIRAFQTLIGA